MRKMNMIVAGLACVAFLGLVLSGCKAEAAAPAENKPVLGGWSIASGNNPSMMNEADSTRIKEALKDEGGKFDALSLVATQVVSGANYMYLVYGTDKNSTVPGYYFVTVYEDTKGNDSIIGMTAIDVTAIQTGTPLGKGATGAWTVHGTGKPGMLPDQDAQASFDAMNKGDVMYNPVALLATQVVSGTNYKALCQGNDHNLYVVTWYKDLQGNSSFTSAECVDIGAYSGL
ncbi:hypothetical protein D6855_09800 [Butyrivibrio sp. CB08]|uniref:hypothetical protein n=1 Tax=Butyrivibrio sp. CB08 TaxID=2364879 RepID=UPI000EAA3C42|nr:hypothetical protein [Butyrivibrio sp. CB08]RKM59190.1 hypothetical protein D6855_09800 [Butyrivibrio sp. CB08]